MFIRTGKTRAGYTAVQVVEKRERRNVLIKHLGTARTPVEATQLMAAARTFIDQTRIRSGVLSFFDTRYSQSELATLMGRLTFREARDSLAYRFFRSFYRTIGCDGIADECFRDLVIARIVEPASKRKTREILKQRFGIRYSLTTIYRTLQGAHSNRYQERIESIVTRFLTRTLQEDVTVLFFDVTTLYFEATDADDFRRYGFSKDHRSDQPQIVVALTVSRSGMPIAYRVFPGNTFEGHTMLPALMDVLKRMASDTAVIVADSAMLSQDNMKQLEEKNVRYIVGARLANLSQTRFTTIATTLPRTHGATLRLPYGNGRVLIVSYSTKRAAKDRHDREKHIKRAEEALKDPSRIPRRYKYVTAQKQEKGYRLNAALIERAKQLEGLKGYITNAVDRSDTEVIEKYAALWQVEKAFRMSKSDLMARPVFHTLQASIEAHLLIVFTALVVSRYVETVSKASIVSVVRTLTAVKEIIVEDPASGQSVSKYTQGTGAAKQLATLANLPWVT